MGRLRAEDLLSSPSIGTGIQGTEVSFVIFDDPAAEMPKQGAIHETRHNRPIPNRKTHKKCAKCRSWRRKTDYGEQEACADGLQSYCKYCKNDLGKQRRLKDLRARISHHMATRITDQLGALTPKKLSKNLETHLGYRIGTLLRHLRDDLRLREGEGASLKKALDSGYHIDHVRPLSSFPVVKGDAVDWEEFKRCWAIENLSAIPAAQNLSKGARYDG